MYQLDHGSVLPVSILGSDKLGYRQIRPSSWLTAAGDGVPQQNPFERNFKRACEVAGLNMNQRNDEL